MCPTITKLVLLLFHWLEKIQPQKPYTQSNLLDKSLQFLMSGHTLIVSNGIIPMHFLPQIKGHPTFQRKSVFCCPMGDCFIVYILVYHAGSAHEGFAQGPMPHFLI